MENYIKLTPAYATNSYLKHFQVAQINFMLAIQEEPLMKRKFRRRNLASGKRA